MSSAAAMFVYFKTRAAAVNAVYPLLTKKLRLVAFLFYYAVIDYAIRACTL